MDGWVSDRTQGVWNCKKCGANMIAQPSAVGDRTFDEDHFEHTCRQCGTKHDAMLKQGQIRLRVA